MTGFHKANLDYSEGNSPLNATVKEKRLYLSFVGCWISTTSECETSSCSYDDVPTSVTLHQKTNFCCCYGSKCNELEKKSKVNGKRKIEVENTNSVAKLGKTDDENVKGWYLLQTSEHYQGKQLN